jgi:hypothetical protein
LAKPITIKPEEEFARAYVDRLILEKLSEMESAAKLSELADRLSSHGVGLATVRSLLATNPNRFTYADRRWVPSSRIAGSGRPLSEAIRLILDAFGAPMPLELVLHELARQRRVMPDQMEAVVRRILEKDAQFVLDNQEQASLTKWGFNATDETVNRALALNGVTAEEVEAAQQKIGPIEWRSEGAVTRALKAAAPVRLKVLGACAWLQLNPEDPHIPPMYDSRGLFAEAVTAPGYVFAPDGTIHPAEDAKKWVGAAVKLADRLAPTIDLEDAAPIEVKAEDIKRLVSRIISSDESVTVTRLLEEFYEITPGNKTFPDDLQNVMAGLRSNASVTWVGGDRFRCAGTLPDFIGDVPEPFKFAISEVVDEEGELIDVELTDEGLSSSLRKLLMHPLATDVLDEDIVAAPKTMPEQLRLVLKSIHRELGTFPLCQIPTAWLDPEPALQELIFVDGAGRELQVWVNHQARLMYNLLDWWFEQPVENGAVFSLTKTHHPNVFEFAWLDQPDPVVYISAQRMEELRRMGESAEGQSTLDLLVKVMSHWPKGADYLTVLAELNVVRRCSRRLVASLLSSYQCFYQRSGSPVWHYDSKKVEQGFDKTKKKFIRKDH